MERDLEILNNFKNGEFNPRDCTEFGSLLSLDKMMELLRNPKTKDCMRAVNGVRNTVNLITTYLVKKDNIDESKRTELVNAFDLIKFRVMSKFESDCNKFESACKAYARVATMPYNNQMNENFEFYVEKVSELIK